MKLSKLVENHYEKAYCKMMNNIEMQDAKDEWIETRAEELIKNFDNDNDWQIIELLKIKLMSCKKAWNTQRFSINLFKINGLFNLIFTYSNTFYEVSHHTFTHKNIYL
jgi:hypothetical protein